VVGVVIEGRDVEVVDDEGTEVELTAESEASPLRPQEVIAIASTKAHRAKQRSPRLAHKSGDWWWFTVRLLLFRVSNDSRVQDQFGVRNRRRGQTGENACPFPMLRPQEPEWSVISRNIACINRRKAMISRWVWPTDMRLSQFW
jgi:hypothetical protein